jgi:hypothetical protein
MALVAARPSSTVAQGDASASKQQELDKDLQRAKDLIELHYSVKVAHSDGKLEKQLDDAREMVRRAIDGTAVRL